MYTILTQVLEYGQIYDGTSGDLSVTVDIVASIISYNVVSKS